MPQDVRHEPVIAVLLPCYNEELTIAEVVRRFRETLPSATIYVYDNNSRDLTALRARAAGAVVVREPRQGKGNVVRRMFADIEADIYLMADGDGTYAPEDAPQLINTLLTERADMVVGTRRGVTDDAGRAGHAFGNRVFNTLYKRLFGSDFTDIFSGYRAFTRRFVKSFPAVSGGFEIETEMSVHASQLKLPVSEIALDYGRRPEGSSSKLSTFRDGAKILWMFGMLMKETQPLRFFGAFAVFFLASSLFLMAPVLVEFAETGLVPRMPTWVLSVGLLLLSMLAAVTGVILDSVSRGRAEQKRIFYLSMPSGRVERRASEVLQKPHAGKKPARGLTMQRVVRFAFAGGLGFASDAVALWLLLAVTPLGPFVARILSIGFALCVTWQINRNLAFSPSSRGVAREGARYGGVGIATSAINYLAYSAILLALPGAPPLLALAAASLIAMTLSFLGYSRLVFDR